MRVVMKFGGTSVGSADAIRHVARIVADSHREHEVVVVVSAMNAPDLRTTDTLIAAAKAAAAGNGEATGEVAPRLLDLHLRAAAELASPEECAALEPELQAMLTYLSNLSHSIAVLGELTPRALDLFSGLGERLNARLIAAALRSAGLAAEAVDATRLIVTDEHYGSASPLMDETRATSRAVLEPMLAQKIVPVVTGFIGATRAGVPTTLGRGGSDYTCGILGAVLEAKEVWFWKEVDGVLTANPKVVPEARTLPRLSYNEMGEMAYYGANVLHPKTVRPLVQQKIPIRIRNTFNPAHPGTIINGTDMPGTARAVTAINDASLITVGGPGMLGLTGVAARIFGAVARVGANTLLITQASSEQSVCLAVPRAEAAAAVTALRAELAGDLSSHNVEHVEVLDQVVIIAVVGSGMRGTPGIAGRVFGALGNVGINIIAIAQGSTENNISLVVAASDGDDAVRAIHHSFDL
ncbi:aspartate kinase [Candidatus Chloroploca sp. M-50]|uniref:Aspartokinase n=1 Tax=Candidatus Chloroploca mongolica TaxID=2528176 RepID=A0ABS4D6J8_9CHLR|nr:aspartate kinase [Candidatus Chloroploca mongolica]MBP1465067.1 aspartate kinase [Candidatus Chloroploca mongolica]